MNNRTTRCDTRYHNFNFCVIGRIFWQTITQLSEELSSSKEALAELTFKGVEEELVGLYKLS